MASTRDPRIDSMYRGDRLGAWLFVGALWLTIAFVLVAVWTMVDDGAIRSVLLIAAGLVLLFNTAAIAAMVKHYAEDKDFIYGLDIKHLDALTAARHRVETPPAAASRRV